MKCKICGEPLKWNEAEWETLVGYISPPDHNHDDNCLNRNYECKNKHMTTLSIQRKCNIKGCDWVGKTNCNICSSGKKLKRWPK